MPTSPDATAGTAGDERDEQRDARAEAQARVRRGRLVTVVTLGVVVVLVAVVALLGGFGRQRIEVTDVAAGTPFATGPFEVTLASATVTYLTRDHVWSVRTTGTIRGTGSSSVEPSLGEDGFAFAALDLDDQGVTPSDVALYDGQFTFPKRNTVAPGVPPVPWVMTFEFTRAPAEKVLVGIYGQSFRTKYVFDDELVWQNTEAVSKIELPLTRLPDDTYDFSGGGTG